MKISAKTRERCVTLIIDYIKTHEPCTKKDIIDGALLGLGLTEKELSSSAPKSKGALARSLMSSEFNTLVNKKDIKRQENGYVLARDELVIVKQEQAQAQILKLLHARPYAKSELYRVLDKHFGTDLTSSAQDDNALHSLAGNILAELSEANRIEYVDGKYREKTLGTDLKSATPLPEDEFKKMLYKRLWLHGGKFFESFCASVLEKYFSMTGQFVIFCDVTGGSDDGGIDIVIETIDGLDFYEKIMVQTKCRDRAQINEKEIRGFYGALNVLGGTRGIFITTTSFHPGAKKLLDSIDNCVGIDGDLLFELIKKTEYGICITKNGYTLDSSVF